MGLFEQMIGIERSDSEPAMEAQIKNAIDYAVRMYGLTYVLDKGPSFIQSLLGDDSNMPAQSNSLIGNILLSSLPVARRFSRLL